VRGEVTIALLGLGTVGTGVAMLIERNRPLLRRRLGLDLRIVGVAVRDPRRGRDSPITRRLLTTDARSLVTDPSVDVVVELFGGYEPARSLVLAAIAAGKDVVTANKALLAVHGREVFAAAEHQGVRLGFEASVGGGVPIIRVLKEALAGDRNRAVYGIVNGTCNSILTAMTDRGSEFPAALAEAQASGLAEADPSLDIDGTDSAHKLALLVALAFGMDCPVAEIHTEGIRPIAQMDVAFARELGYVIKLLAIAKDDGKRVEARVHPTMIPRTHLLADVRDAFNAIHIQGDALGSTMYVGPGAGRLPTATSVLADVVEIARQRAHPGERPPPPLGIPVAELRAARLRPIGAIESEYYLRFLVVDRPGVLGRIAGILGRRGISIASVIQKDRRKGNSVPIIIRTHEARESSLRRALSDIGRLAAVRGKPFFMRIEDRL
jgi:homoserine dehydrogenase